MTEQWQELKETITEMRDNDGTGTQQETCKFLVDYMEVLEKQMQEPCEDCRNCKNWNKCPCGKEGHENGTSIGYSIGECKDYEPCEDCISRESLRRKLQEHHDFFVNAYGGFGNLPQSDKPRVDEIDNCIAMIVNEPPVYPERPKGKWILDNNGWDTICNCCGQGEWHGYIPTPEIATKWMPICPKCGAKMGEDNEDNN